MKKVLFLLAFIVAGKCLSAQTFLHGAGVGFAVSKPATDGLDTKVFFTLHYYPQMTFVENEAFSVSAGVPLTVGLSGSYSANFSTRGDSYEENSLLLNFQAPVMVNFNGGAGSSKENEQRFGYFIGGGFGYQTTGVANEGEYYQPDGTSNSSKIYSSGFAPAANAGIRFAVGSHQKNIEVRLSYMQGLNTHKPSVFGLNAAFNF